MRVLVVTARYPPSTDWGGSATPHRPDQRRGKCPASDRLRPSPTDADYIQLRALRAQLSAAVRGMPPNDRQSKSQTLDARHAPIRTTFTRFVLIYVGLNVMDDRRIGRGCQKLSGCPSGGSPPVAAR